DELEGVHVGAVVGDAAGEGVVVPDFDAVPGRGDRVHEAAGAVGLVDCCQCGGWVDAVVRQAVAADVEGGAGGAHLAVGGVQEVGGDGGDLGIVDAERAVGEVGGCDAEEAVAGGYPGVVVVGGQGLAGTGETGADADRDAGMQVGLPQLAVGAEAV